MVDRNSFDQRLGNLTDDLLTPNIINWLNILIAQDLAT